MRVISGLMAMLIGASVSQPAWAVCVIRGGAKTCSQDADTPKDANSMAGARIGTPSSPSVNKKIIVLQPGSSSDAWILAPQTNTGAVVLGAADATSATCGSEAAC
jgi:hypothetical protein